VPAAPIRTTTATTRMPTDTAALHAENTRHADGLRALCDWAVACRREDIPLLVRQRAAMVLVDDIAAMLAGATEPEPARLRALAQARRPLAEAPLLAPGLPRVDRQQAASLNAVFGSWCELDEGFRPTICHAGIYVLPVLLAEASAEGHTLGQLLRALTLGYELVTRLALSARYPTPVVHAHALWSSTGAAAALVLLRGGDAATLFRAVTAAATTASLGPRPHLAEGVLVRNGWAAAGAMNGQQCADWAAAGIGGSDASFPAVHRDLLGATLLPAALTTQLGQQWSVMSGYHKIYACCQHGHAAVEAALALAEGVDLADVAAIEVATHPLALSLPDPSPRTTLGAKFSLPHMVAAALVYRDGGAEAFSQAALTQRDVVRLRPLVRLLPWNGPLTPPHDRPACVTLVLRDGRRHEATCLSAWGGPDRPLPRERLLRKINGLCAGVLPGLPALLLGEGALPEGMAWDAVLAQAARGG
jgi:2-methylcitrate dehydratase PrpD